MALLKQIFKLPQCIPMGVILRKRTLSITLPRFAFMDPNVELVLRLFNETPVVHRAKIFLRGGSMITKIGKVKKVGIV